MRSRASLHDDVRLPPELRGRLARAERVRDAAELLGISHQRVQRR